MMKMHGLGDWAYWAIQVGGAGTGAGWQGARGSHARPGRVTAGVEQLCAAAHRRLLPPAALQYCWFFAINFVFTWILIIFGRCGGQRMDTGCSLARPLAPPPPPLNSILLCPCPRRRPRSAINVSFFRRTSYSFQFVFYLLWINCLISFAFLLSACFRASKTGGRAAGAAAVAWLRAAARLPPHPLLQLKTRSLPLPPHLAPRSRDRRLSVRAGQRAGGLPAAAAVCEPGILVDNLPGAGPRLGPVPRPVRDEPVRLPRRHPGARRGGSGWAHLGAGWGCRAPPGAGVPEDADEMPSHCPPHTLRRTRLPQDTQGLGWDNLGDDNNGTIAGKRGCAVVAPPQQSFFAAPPSGSSLPLHPHPTPPLHPCLPRSDDHHGSGVDCLHAAGLVSRHGSWAQ